MENKVKVGDEVYVVTRSFVRKVFPSVEVLKTYGIVSELDNDGFYVNGDDIYVWYEYDRYYPKEVYESQLFKVMQELEDV